MGRYAPGARLRPEARVIAEFWANVDRSGGPDACWPWTAGRTSRGYGRAWYTGKTRQAHRLAWLFSGFPLSVDEMLRHQVCDNPPCCNPAHLAPGTHLDNMRDMREHGRAAHRGGIALGDRNGSLTHPESRPRGTSQRRAKLTDEAVRELRRLFASGGHTTYALAKAYGVSQSTVAQIVRGVKWRHVA